MDERAQVEELIRRSGDDLDEALALTGLYVVEKNVVARDGPGGSEFAIAINASLGRLAFSTRVQDPEGNAVDDAFAEVTETFERDEASEASRAFRERLASLQQQQREDPGSDDGRST